MQRLAGLVQRLAAASLQQCCALLQGTCGSRGIRYATDRSGCAAAPGPVTTHPLEQQLRALRSLVEHRGSLGLAHLAASADAEARASLKAFPLPLLWAEASA